MAQKLIEIKITKATLYLTEDELLANLPQHIIELGLRRGRAIKRWRQANNRAPKSSKEQNQREWSV